MEKLIMHPLFTRIENQQTCLCSSKIPDMQNFQLCVPAHDKEHTLSVQATEQALRTWLTRRRIALMCPKIGIVDMDRKNVFLVDMLAENSSTESVVFLLISTSKQRIVKQRRKNMLKLCSYVKTLAKTVYHIEPEVHWLNIYGNNRITSSMV